MYDTIRHRMENFGSIDFSSPLFTYWLPLLVCAAMHIHRCVKAYRTDLKESTRSFYQPNLTVGRIMWYFAISVIPVVNIITILYNVIDEPIVRHSYK